MFEPTLVGSFSRMVNFLRISWSILSPSVVNFYAHLVNSRCRLQVKLDDGQRQPSPISKALQIKRNEHETIIVYNHINGYILDALVKAVFTDAH